MVNHLLKRKKRVTFKDKTCNIGKKKYIKKEKKHKPSLKDQHMKYDKNWNEKTHYGQCGQSCPCCRWEIAQEPFGSCEICKNYS